MTSNVVPENTTPPNSFGTTIGQNDLSDSFDCQKVLKKVPKTSESKARILLEKIGQRPNDITFDSKGVLYINQESIPDSNVFVIFPYLFKQRVKKKIPGLMDFVQKITEMNLGHLITLKNKQPIIIKRPSSTSAGNWWYLT